MSETSLQALSVNERANPWLKTFCNQLNAIRHGRLSLTLPNGQTLHFGKSGPQATLILKSYKPASRFLMQGDLALAESYMDGEWDCPDLSALFDVALMNQNTLTLNNKGGWLYRTFNRLRHLLNANSKKGSKRNISYHYDLGNDFYRHWLDDTMTYSSALFEGDESLQDAQLRKYRTIADMAELKAGENVLEIGCGWGGFSQVAAQEYGSHIHGVTLSREQLAYAQDRYRRHGIDHLASVSLTDYRDIEATYDKIVSIEMFEAVGYENWDTYFSTLKKSLKPGGCAVLQIILIEDERFESYRKSVDFIQRYIFPGGLLPSVETLGKALEKNKLSLTDSHLFGASYAKTCEIWQKNFQHAWDDIKPLGFDARFKRMWEYYLSYCEAGFKAGSIDVGLFKIVNDKA
jgi:cyclopropane-fatty-acyl-phospholipid synthase